MIPANANVDDDLYALSSLSPGQLSPCSGTGSSSHSAGLRRFMSLIILERRWLHRLCLPRFPPIRFTSGPTVPFEEDVPRNVFFKFSFPAYLNRNARDCVLIFDKNPLKVGHRNISSVRRENGFSSTCEPFIRSDNCYSMLTILQSRPSFAAGETSLRRVHRRGSYKRLSG